ncbi:MAG: SLC13 family permease [Bacillota bacterium]
MTLTKIVTLIIFVACYSLAISRKVKIAYASVGAAVLLMVLGIVSPRVAATEAIKWDVLGIYWGFMMVSFVFLESRVPALLAQKIIQVAPTEKWVLLSLCALTAFLSAFMENVGVVLMMAPIALELSRRLGTPLFPYIVSIAISSNVVTTVTMVADPPPIILAMETGLVFKDFYWFQGKPGLGLITIVGVLAALLTLAIQFRGWNRKVDMPPERIPVTYGASILFVVGVLGLAFGPEFGIRPGIVGMIAGLVALYLGRNKLREMIIEFDWNSFFFIVGVFVVISSLEITGLLADFATAIHSLVGGVGPALCLAVIIWVSVAASSFMDNVPYTVLMIPVCEHLASLMGVSPWPFLFGMLIGTGIGGNITPVGAAANVFACGYLEKHGHKVELKQYLKLGIPFSVTAVAVAHLLLQLIWG